VLIEAAVGLGVGVTTTELGLGLTGVTAGDIEGVGV
jgi:hypothetical protein